MVSLYQKVGLFSIILLLFFLIYLNFYEKLDIQPIESKVKLDIKTVVHYDEKQYSDIIQIIHQSYKTEEIPKINYKYLLSWRNECYPHWKYMFWTDVDNYNFINKHYNWFIKYYNLFPRNILKADVSRYFYMYHYGGVYTDLDNECLRRFDHLLTGHKLVFGTIEGKYGDTLLKEGYVQNSFMYSGQKKHPFWLYLIKKIANLIEQNGKIPAKGVEAITGPIILTESIHNYRVERCKGWEDIKIYSHNYFNPFSWIVPEHSDKSCKTFGKMSLNEWQTCRKSLIKRGSYVAQYHHHSW